MTSTDSGIEMKQLLTRTRIAHRVVSVSDLSDLVGERVGVSRWQTITQDQINRFADATGDHQWIHTDPERARNGPYGTTIAHGYLTLSLAPGLLWEVLDVTGTAQVVNYGIGRVRFPAPVPVGSRIRIAVDIVAAEVADGWVQPTLGVTFEIEGSVKPACVAEILLRYYAAR